MRVADQMLDGARMPVGSRPLTHASPDEALISVTADTLFLAASVTRTRLYRTAATPAVALAAIRGGISTRVPGATSVRAGSDTRGPDLIEGVTYPVIDAGRLGVRQLAVAAQTASAGPGAQGTVVRIQAEVQWIARRLPGQAIPRSARVVDITRPADPGLPGPSGRRRHAPAISLTVTRPAWVTALARDVDALPLSSTGTLELACTASPRPPIVTFTFRARARGQALATARVSAATPLTLDPCRTASLSIGGRTQLGLMDARVLLDRADALLDRPSS